MKDRFQIAVGSVTGREHIQTGKNNQDAFYYISNDVATIAVVCDGCSSGKHSEVGSKIGAKVIAEVIALSIQRGSVDRDAEFWQQVQDAIATRLETIALCLGDSNYKEDEKKTEQDLSTIVNDYFLFTIVGALITKSETVIFSVGDGVIAINDKVKPIGVKYKNMPSYFGYRLCGYPQWVQWEIQAQLSTTELDNLLIGTDGVNDLIAVQTKCLPSKEETVGCLSQFWQDDRYFRNPDMIRRRLSLINRQTIKPDWQNQSLRQQQGLLPDDTTLLVIRKENL